MKKKKKKTTGKIVNRINVTKIKRNDNEPLAV